MEIKPLDEKVEKILTTTTVSRAQEIMISRSGWWLVAVISFIESATPLPIITDPFMMAAILLNKKKYLQIVFITTVSSVLGGILAYVTAMFFLDIALNVLAPEAAFSLANMVTTEQSNIFVLTLLGAFTPVPYTVTAWAVGILKGNLVAFIAASVVGRGARYLIVGWVTYHFGSQAVQIARRYIGLTSIVIIVLAALFFWLKM